MDTIRLFGSECLKKLISGTYEYHPSFSSEPLETFNMRDRFSAYTAPWRGNYIGLTVITAIKIFDITTWRGRGFYADGGNCWHEGTYKEMLNKLFIADHMPVFSGINGVDTSNDFHSRNKDWHFYLKSLMKLNPKERYIKISKDLSDKGINYWL